MPQRARGIAAYINGPVVSCTGKRCRASMNAIAAS